MQSTCCVESFFFFLIDTMVFFLHLSSPFAVCTRSEKQKTDFEHETTGPNKPNQTHKAAENTTMHIIPGPKPEREQWYHTIVLQTRPRPGGRRTGTEKKESPDKFTYTLCTTG